MLQIIVNNMKAMNTEITYQLREDDLWFINEERNKYERVRHHMRIAVQTNQTIVTYYITKW